MKQLLLYTIIATVVLFFVGCKKSGYGNYPGAEITPYISIFDVRSMYKGQDVTLTRENLFGSTSLAAVVISDHSGNNLPEGLVFVQEARRLGQLRGIAINVGAEARNYTPGDSVLIKLEGGVLTKKDGITQITGISSSNITKHSKVTVIPTIVSSNALAANPERYESTLIAIVDGSFIPLPQAGEIMKGYKTINDGSGNVGLFTLNNASFADDPLYGRANYYGIVVNTDVAGTLIPALVPRVKEDIILLSSSSEQIPFIISGYMADPNGSDANHEYIQLLAVQDINFATTPYSVVITNNAGNNTPQGLPQNGWGTGGLRTFKFNLTSGTVKKGAFFYVGGSNKLINSSSSTSIASANWIRSFNYSTGSGGSAGDGFGNRTDNLLANSGNISGIAAFKGTAVNLSSVPVDAIFIGTSGNLLIWDPATPQYGYSVADNDLYKRINLITLEPQPFYLMGTNRTSFSYNASNLGFFVQLGGKYNTTMARWTQRREQRNILLTKASQIEEIQDSLSTKLMRLEGVGEVEDK